jgi:hypothetical protein
MIEKATLVPVSPQDTIVHKLASHEETSDITP